MTVEWRIGMYGKEIDCDQMEGNYRPTNLPFAWTESNHKKKTQSK